MNRTMKQYFFLTAMVFALAISAFAQNATKESEEAAYLKVLNKRAGKIVNKLDIPDPSKEDRVQEIIVQQYWNLSKIHDDRDAKIEEVKKNSELDKEKEQAQIEKVEKKADKKLDKLHKSYLAKLSKELTSEQVNQVKDGMTYNVLPNTYNGYLDMLPDLTEKQKEQIMEYLVEAREQAMDAGSSEKKHWWFGKYKGKINNYLSAAGYDLKKAGDEWEKRRNAKAGN